MTTPGGGLIGIVGGVGPYAGLDLVEKVFDHTAAVRDQEHLPVALLSIPSAVGDRTEFLLGATDVNPGDAIGDLLLRLERMGATVAGIACNTAHARPIWDAITTRLGANGSRLRVLHMIDEVVAHLRERAPGLQSVGVLATTGTRRSRTYHAALESAGYAVVDLDDELQETLVHWAIYDTREGIKARSNPVGDAARTRLVEAVGRLERMGAGAVILGCTEIPLALPESRIGVPLVDPAVLLARALVRAVSPARLRPWAGDGPG